MVIKNGLVYQENKTFLKKDLYILNGIIVDKEFVYSIINKAKFIEFNLENNDDICLDIEEQNNRINDSEAREIIKEVCGYSNASEIRKLDIAERNKCIKALKDGGLSIRQISRITGVSKYAVEKS